MGSVVGSGVGRGVGGQRPYGNIVVVPVTLSHVKLGPIGSKERQSEESRAPEPLNLEEGAGLVVREEGWQLTHACRTRLQIHTEIDLVNV